MTRKEIREKVEIDAGILGHEMFPQARLNEMIDQAQRYVQIKLNGVGLKKWASTYSPASYNSSTWAGYEVTYVSLPSDFLEGHDIINATTTASGVTGYAVEVKNQDFEERLRNSYTTPTTKYPVLTRMDNRYYIYPRVTNATLRYYKRVSDLSTDSSTPGIPLEYHDMIVDKVVLEVKKILHNQEYVLEDRKLDKEIENAFLIKERNKEVKNDIK